MVNKKGKWYVCSAAVRSRAGRKVAAQAGQAGGSAAGARQAGRQRQVAAEAARWQARQAGAAAWQRERRTAGKDGSAGGARNSAQQWQAAQGSEQAGAMLRQKGRAGGTTPNRPPEYRIQVR